MKSVLVLTFALIVFGGCGPAAAPTPSPGGFADVISALVLRGATIRQHVSGDAGCPQSELHSNALRLEVSLGGAQTETVYLFRWRRESDYQAAAGEFAACVAQQEGDAVALEHSPWRAYGAGWTEDLRTILAQALDEAGT